MKIKRDKYNSSISIDMNIVEAENLMHVIWFGLDFEAREHKMTEWEKELGEKLLRILKDCVLNTDEWEI